jgi:hypothetical protein
MSCDRCHYSVWKRACQLQFGLMNGSGYTCQEPSPRASWAHAPSLNLEAGL